MSDHPHLSKAPITEALIDLRVKLPPGFDVQRLHQAGQELSKLFPNLVEGHGYLHEVQIKGKIARVLGGEAGKLIGFRYSTATQAIQFRLDAMVLNKLRPYTRWEDMFEQLKRIWPVYKEAAPEAKLTRIGTRYINHLDLPESEGSLARYLTTPPRLPERLPYPLRGFFLRTEMAVNDSGLSATLTQASERRGHETSRKVMLDIDAYKEVTETIQDEQIWYVLGALRKLKNDIFFAAITPATIERYQ